MVQQHRRFRRRPVHWLGAALLLTSSVLCSVYALTPGHNADTFLDVVQGYYSAPARYCTELSGDRLVPCASGNRDCMLIKRVDQSHVQLRIYSVQANGHQCGVSGIAAVRDGQIEYVGGVQDGPDRGKHVIIAMEGGRLTIHYRKDDDSVSRAPVCANEARLDLLQFSIDSKRPVGTNVCSPY